MNKITLVCEEGNSQIEAISNLLVPHNNKIIFTQKPQIVLEKLGMYRTNCYRINHNVEIVKSKERKTMFL
jgi:hypothetical protein